MCRRDIAERGRGASPRVARVELQRLPRYRLLTGPDDATFCRRVSDALDLGYELCGGPAATFDGSSVILAQAVLWSRDEPTPAA